MANNTNQGTSPKIPINGAALSARKGFKLSPIDNSDINVNPPVPSKPGEPSPIMYQAINPFRDFTFAPVSFPDYNGIAQITGVPSNTPDKIADFHFIALARCIDHLLLPQYKGVISGKANTPSSK